MQSEAKAQLQIVDGLRALRGRFDGYLVDLWGVVHDGERPFAGVVAALAQLADSGARVCFVSNSSRLGSDLAARLVEMGIERPHFVDVVSSGDVTRAAMLARDPAVFAGLSPAPRVLHVGHRSFVPWLFELPLTFVEDATNAELIVSTGTVPDQAALQALLRDLTPLVARDVPLVCTNPDRLVRSAKGLHLAPGAIAHAYVEAGGRAFFYGKPHAPIYRAALARLGVDRDRVVGLGDMLDTDVLGARDAGLASVLIAASGVHAAEIDEHPSGLERLCARVGVTPDFVLERLAWAL